MTKIDKIPNKIKIVMRGKTEPMWTIKPQQAESIMDCDYRILFQYVRNYGI